MDDERFWSKIDKSGDCWLWTAGSGSTGYGYFYIGRVQYAAHRFAWVSKHGPIPAGMQVLHSCDVRRCVRHLFLGTQSDNIQDMHNKGRGFDNRGSRHPLAKLTEEDVEEIRRL